MLRPPTLEWLEYKSKWPGLNKAFAVHRETVDRKTGKTTEEWSYYITSLDLPATELNLIAREHWGIESMHWLLDVVFAEDDTRVLSENGLKTLNVVRKLAICRWKQFIAGLTQKTKPSIRKSMLKALLSSAALLAVL